MGGSPRCGVCMSDLYLVLHNIRSAYNVGAILRTADGAGVKKVYLCGYTPTPFDRFGRARADVAKVALGAERIVVWEYCEGTISILEKLRSEGVTVVGLEQDACAVPINLFKCGSLTALVLGSEVEGLSTEVLQHCDAIVEIPMYGKKESLNVSIAAGIALYALHSAQLTHPTRTSQ